MKPKPFRLPALLEVRALAKDIAAQELALAAQREMAELRSLAGIDARCARARGALCTGGAAGKRMREAAAALEFIRTIRPRFAESARAATQARELRSDAHARASVAWTVVNRLRERAHLKRRAYEELLEQDELDESNRASARRKVGN